MGNFYFKEINSREEAIELGKGRGWCTAKEDNDYYDTNYNKNKGSLYIIYKESKKKPQYQIFFSNNGSIEFKAKFNKFVEPYSFFEDEGKELKRWFHNNIEKHRHLVSMKSRRQGASYEMNDIINEEMLTRPYIEGHFTTRYTFDPNLIIENEDEERSYYGIGNNEPVFRVELIIPNRVNNIHLVNELPPPDMVGIGTVFSIQENRKTLIKIKDHRGISVYYEVKSLESVQPPLERFDINNSEPISAEYINSEIKLEFLLHRKYSHCFDNCFYQVENPIQTHNFEYTVKYRERIT